MFRRGRLDQDLDEELRSHLEMRAADNLAAGMSARDARYDAQKRFGNTTLLKEDTRSVDIIGWLDECARDSRFALRMLQRSPGFAAVAVLTSLSALGRIPRFSPSLTPFSSAPCPIRSQTVSSASGSLPSSMTVLATL